MLLTGGLLAPMASCSQKEEARTNWAGNLAYATDKLLLPKSVEEVQKMVRGVTKLRALGTRHSFNRIADSVDNQISLQGLDQTIEIDPSSNSVTVGAGVTYGKLAPYLHERGYALHNLASLPHISVAGACATATHGSGVQNGNLSSAVSAIELVTAEGEVVSFSLKKDAETFSGSVVGLGGLGVVTKVTLDIQPTFNVRQDVYLDLPMAQLKDHFDEIMSSGYSVSLFTDWTGQRVNQVWVKRRVDGNTSSLPQDFYGATAAIKNVHPIISISAENCTEQMGVPGPWHERLPHFKMNFTPSSGKELQAEYFVPRHHAIEAILAVDRLHEQISPLLQISEIRSINADTLWMSPCFQQPCIAIHFTLKQDWPAVKNLLPVIEKELTPFEARPHWAKLFTMSPERLQPLYGKLPDFQALLKHYDPKGKFRNEFLDTNIFGGQA